MLLEGAAVGEDRTRATRRRLPRERPRFAGSKLCGRRLQHQATKYAKPTKRNSFGFLKETLLGALGVVVVKIVQLRAVWRCCRR
jgi:hypothetical protein